MGLARSTRGGKQAGVWRLLPHLVCLVNAHHRDAHEGHRACHAIAVIVQFVIGLVPGEGAAGWGRQLGQK